VKPVKVLNSRTIRYAFTVNSWSLGHDDDTTEPEDEAEPGNEDEDGTEAAAEPGGGSRRHQPEG
jgi:hypothetical protein